jgi:predicted Zn-dependent peptidase
VPAVNDLARLFLEKQPEDARTTLALIEDTVTKAAALKEEEFQQARDTILERTQSLTDSFNKKAGYKKPKPTFFKRLRSALGI